MWRPLLCKIKICIWIGAKLLDCVGWTSQRLNLLGSPTSRDNMKTHYIAATLFTVSLENWDDNPGDCTHCHHHGQKYMNVCCIFIVALVKMTMQVFQCGQESSRQLWLGIKERRNVMQVWAKFESETIFQFHSHLTWSRSVGGQTVKIRWVCILTSK